MSCRNIPTKIAEIEGKTLKSISCGYYHSMVLNENGEVYAFGRNDKGQLGLVSISIGN
jgi:alpha-tubulin suppressor-like RCC1 family protein